MNVRIIRTAAELESLREPWNQMPRSSPMQSLDWYLAWWAAYGEPGSELSVIVVTDADEWIAVAPWYVRTSLGFRQIRCLGDGHACSDHATVLCQPGREDQAMFVLADWLLRHPTIHWHQLSLESIDDDDQAIDLLIGLLRDRGCLVNCRSAPGSCYVKLPNSWDEYLANLSKNHRKRCRRWHKEFFASGRAHVEVAREPDPCEAAFKTLVRLHHDRRTSIGEPSAFASTRFLDFHVDAVAAMAATRQLQLRILHVDDEPVAAEYVLDNGQELFAYQSGLSQVGSQVSAGSLSVLAMMRDAVTAGYHRVDLLRGKEDYKFSWGAIHRSATTFTVRRGTTSGRIGALCDSAWGQAKKLKQRLVASS